MLRELLHLSLYKQILLLDISTRKKYLEQMIEGTVLFPPQKKELYEAIRDSGILNY